MTIIIVETIDGVFGVMNEVMNRPTTISGPRIFPHDCLPNFLMSI